MAMDYPDAKDWSLYYAQSVSLTRFLVEQGPPEQFVQFVRNSHRDGDRGCPARRLSNRRVRRAARPMDWSMRDSSSQPLKEARRDPSAQPAATVVR